MKITHLIPKKKSNKTLYSTLIYYNINMKYYNICNQLVKNKLLKKGKITPENDEYEYKVDFANLIRNLNDHLFKMIINPTKVNINFYSSWIIKESCLEYNKIKKYRKYPRYKIKRGSNYSRSYGKM